MIDYKCVLVGSSGVGKTSILKTIFKINKNQFSSTVGKNSNSQINIMKSGREILNIKLLDTSGNERYRKISREHIKGSEGILLVFDLTNRKSFEDLINWVKDIRLLCDKDIPIFLIGNKNDLNNDRKVTKTEAEKFAACHNLEYLEINSFQEREVKLMFKYLISNLLQGNFLEN